jgi:hypothetical protein
MARLPRYQRLGVTARQPRSIDFAGFREEANVGMAMSQTFDQMSKFLYERAGEEAQQRGLERVRTEGAQPILEELRMQGGPRGIEEKTAYEAANRIAVAELQSEADLEITKILTQGQNNKTSFSTVQTQLKDITDGFAASLSDIDPVSAGLLRARLTETTGKAEMRYSKWYTTYQAGLRKEKQNRVSANEAEIIIGNATVAGYTIEAIESDIEKAITTLGDLGVKSENITAWAKSVREKAIKEKTVFDFYQKPITEQREQIEAILSGKESLPGMNFEDSIRFVNGLLRPEYNRSVAAVKAEADFLVNKVDELEDILESGGRISAEDLETLRSAAVDVSEQDGTIGSPAVKAVNDLSELEGFYASMRGTSLSDMEENVLSLQNGIKGVGKEGIDTTLEVDRLDRAQKFLTNMKTQISQDPMGYADRQGIIQRQSILSVDEDNKIQVNQNALQKRQKQAMQVAAQYGLQTPKFLFADEARRIGLLLNQAEGAAKLDILGALSSFDAAAGQVLEDIAEYNPEMALVGALVNAGNTETALLAVQGMDRIKAGEKPIGFTPTNIELVHNRFGRAITTPKHHAAIKDVAKAIYTEMAASKGVFAWSDELYEQAYQMAAGQTTRNGKVYGGIQEVRGIQTFVMPEMTANDLETYLNEINVDVIQLATGQQISDNLAEQIKENDNYNFRNIGGNKYFIEYGKDGTATVSDADGRPVIIDITQLQKSFGLVRPEETTLETPPEETTLETSPEEAGLDADILTPIQYQEAILGITPGQKGLLESEATEPEAPVIEEPVEKSKLELQTDSLKKMLDTVPVEIQRATSLENRKLLKKYKEKVSEEIVDDPNFFLSYDDWLKGETKPQPIKKTPASSISNIIKDVSEEDINILALATIEGRGSRTRVILNKALNRPFNAPVDEEIIRQNLTNISEILKYYGDKGILTKEKIDAAMDDFKTISNFTDSKDVKKIIERSEKANTRANKNKYTNQMISNLLQGKPFSMSFDDWLKTQ